MLSKECIIYYHNTLISQQLETDIHNSPVKVKMQSGIDVLKDDYENTIKKCKTPTKKDLLRLNHHISSSRKSLKNELSQVEYCNGIELLLKKL